jgi:Cohesin domain
MQTSRRFAARVTSSGLSASRARLVLRLAFGLLLVVLSVLWLSPGPSGVARGERALNDGGRIAKVASTGTVIVNLNPSSSSVATGQIFTVDIQIVAGAQQVDAAEIHLTFDQTYLQVVNAAGNPVQQIEDLSGWDAPLANHVYTDTAPARILFAAGILGSGTKPSGTFSLARIRFKALQSTGGGSTPLVFGMMPPEQTQIYYGITSVLGGVENGSVTISGQTPTVTPTPLLRTVFLPVVIRHR